MFVSPDITVRKAERADFWRLWPVLLEMQQDHNLFPLSEKKGMLWLANLIDSPQAWVFISEQHGEITGTIAVEVCGLRYSDATYLDEQWIFVRSQYRGGRSIFRLCRALGKLSRELDLPLSVRVFPPTEPVWKVALFKRYFTMVGHSVRRKNDSTDERAATAAAPRLG